MDIDYKAIGVRKAVKKKRVFAGRKHVEGGIKYFSSNGLL